MEIKTNIKPKYIRGNNKKDIVEKITQGCYLVYQLIQGIRIHGNITQNKKPMCVRVYNLIKHNRVTVHTKDKQTKIVTPMYWEGWFYDIPVDILISTGLSIEQKERNFRLYKR